MIQGKKVLAIIPARAGSKRVPKKNIREVAGLPLIAWTIKDLKKSKYIDHAYVSTDSTEIQSVAKSYGVDCEPLRPEELATDTASSADVVMDIIQNKKTGFDIILLLQPTSPLRKLAEIDDAIEEFIKSGSESMVSVCETETHPSWSTPLDEGKSLKQLLSNIQAKRSQDLEKHYRLNGAIYLVYAEAFRRDKSFFLPLGCTAYVMSKKTSVDVDTEEDLYVAESLLLREKNNKNS